MNSRVVYFDLGGEAYPLCFTLRAAEAFYQRYGEIDGWFPRLMELTRQEETNTETGETKVLVEGDQMKLLAEVLWLLETLMDAGTAHVWCNSGDAPDALKVDDLRDLVCIGDVPRIKEAIMLTTAAGNVREVGAQAPKNGEGAEAAASAPTS